MNNFIFENATKIYFGQGCVKEYLGCLLKDSHTCLLYTSFDEMGRKF